MNTQRIIKNFIYTVAGGILSLGTTGCSGNKAETTDSFSTLEAQFSNPSPEYRTAPFMVWNGKVTEIEIDRMLKDFKDAGCGHISQGCGYLSQGCGCLSQALG